MRGVANAWVAAFVMVGVTWLNQEYLLGETRSRKGAVTVLYIVIVLTVSVYATRLARNRIPLWSSRHWATFVAAPLIGLVLTFGFMVEQRPIDVREVESLPVDGARPNVVLISLDTVRADRMSIYGGRAATPHLNNFLQTATLYRRAAAPSNYTFASHASLFTGLYPSRHVAHFVEFIEERPLEIRFRTLAERLAGRGYYTMGVVANYGYLGSGMGLTRGFHYYDYAAPVMFLGESRDIYLRHVARDVIARFSSSQQADVRFHDAREITRRVSERLGRVQHAGRPFFLFVNYMDAHWPYLPPEPFDRMYPGKIGNFTTRRYMNLWRDVSALRRSVHPEERQHLESQYDGAITYLDESVGKLIDRLRDLGCTTIPSSSSRRTTARHLAVETSSAMAIRFIRIRFMCHCWSSFLTPKKRGSWMLR